MLGGKVARAFVEQARNHVGDARLAGFVRRRAAAPGDVHDDDGHFVFLHEPGLDAARAHHPFDIHGGGGKRGEQKKAERERNGTQWHGAFEEGTHHDRPSGSSSPVTDQVPEKIFLAASATSFFVTSRTQSGHS